MDSIDNHGRPLVILREADVKRAFESTERLILGLAVRQGSPLRYHIYLADEGKLRVENRLWPCLITKLAEPQAIDDVNEGLGVAEAKLSADGDDLSNQRGVLVFGALDGSNHKRFRAFAGPLDELIECEVEIEATGSRAPAGWDTLEEDG